MDRVIVGQRADLMVVSRLALGRRDRRLRDIIPFVIKAD